MNIRMFRSLKAILAGIVVGIVAVLTIILVAISYNASYDAVENAYLNQLQNFNKDIAQQLELFYIQQENTAEFLASTDSVSKGNLGEAIRMLKDFQDRHGIYQYIFIGSADNNCDIIAATNPKAVGTRVSNNPAYHEIIKNALEGKTAISSPQKSMVTNLPIIAVAAPIKNGNTITGILGLVVDVSTFSQAMIEGVKIGATGYPFVAEINGLVFAHPSKDMILKLNMKDEEWGKRAMASADGTVIRYEWQGKGKILSLTRNTRFGFITASTMFVSDINESARAMAATMVIFGLLGLILTAIAIYYVIAKRLKPLDECRNVINDMAQGDLRGRYTGTITDDEIGDMAKAVNESMNQFEKLISELVLSAQNLSQAVQEIASGNENLSQRTSEQASSLEEIASTIEEATATIRQNADNAMEANKMSTTTSHLASQGGQIVVDSVNSINEINESSRKIEEIISVINEIAFQTNLLALNAAVEAARAGEQGRGFAVVAGEVRNLAQRAGTAAKEISVLIQSSVEKIENGTQLVNQSGEALREIIESVNRVGTLISEISAASEEQKQGLDQINIAVMELDNMTQQNSALVEETASASEEMANQAQEMLSMVEKFKISRTIIDDMGTNRHEIHLRAAEHTTPQKQDEKKPEAAGGDKKPDETEKKDPKDIAKTMSDQGFVEF